MTQALAERAVEVTRNVSYLLEGAEETPQLLDNIFQLEQYGFSLSFEFQNPDSKVPRTLRDIYVFTQSETQRNLLLRILFAKDLRVHYISLDMQLRGLVKQFEVLHQTYIRSNNSSAIHARYSNLFGIYSVPLMLHSGSIFHNANNFAVLGGTYYAAQSLVIKQVQGENSL